MKTQTPGFYSVTYLSLALLLMAASASTLAAEDLEPRVSTSAQAGGASLDEFEPLIVTGNRTKSTRGSGQQEASAADRQSGATTANIDFWIYDASVELFDDWDGDGYYVGIDLTFDADTVYTAADVYAVIYLSYDFGPWNEYSSTDDFTIFGSSGTDEYSVETELVSGYVTGNYDILIELFDAYDGSFVASFGPDDAPDLSYLPLEDTGRDTPLTTTVIVREGGGGSSGLLGLLILLGVTGWKKARAASA